MQKTRLLWIGLVALLIIGVSSNMLLVAQDTAADNLRIAFVSNRLGNEDIYLMTLAGERGPVSNLTNNPARDWDPAWSPQGDRLIFNSDRDGRETLYVMNADGTNARPLFPGETSNDYDAAWSPDGAQILFTSDRAGAGRELYIASSDGSNVQPLQEDSDGALKGDPAWSPDGQEFVYWEVQNESGEIHLFRRSLDDEDTRQLVTNAGPANGAPVWMDDTIYFDSNRDGDFWYIYRMRSNGDRPQLVSAEAVNSGRATLAPDGSRLAFVTDRDESDEIYVMNVDGSRLIRLTSNGFSDHSPAWQPAIPENQIIEAIEPVAEATEEAGSSMLGAAVGLNANGVIAHPITIQQLMIDYGIAAWHEAGWTGAGQRIGVIDTAFGGLNSLMGRSGEVALPPDDSVSIYSDDINEHGTRVLEVIQTIAPNADFYACRYNGTLPRLKDCVRWMNTRGVNIINHSVGLPVLPINGQSEWAELVNSTFAKGVLWVNSSGNFNEGYLSDNFQDRDGDNYHNFIIGSQERDRVIPVEGAYTGTILLSWLEGDITLINPTTGLTERINLDLEIISAATGELLNPDTGQNEQNRDPNLPPVEFVRLSNVREPFAIKVRNAGAPLDRPIEFAIFIEYMPIEDHARTGSVVGPADAFNSLTVGSVDGNRELASYSSRGLNIADYQKPDISAPGEIILSDNYVFVGTSAAAPVVSGIAALLMEEDPALTTDQIPYEIKGIWLDSRPSLAFGAGIIQLGPPPSSRMGDVVIETPPKTVFPQPVELFEERNVTCASRLPTRFEIGVTGYVNYDLQLSIRSEPSTESFQLAQLPFGEPFEVIGGPSCGGGMTWWLVELGTGAEGWIGEGFDYYLIAPTNLERARLPNIFDSECPNAPDSLLEIGDQGRVLRGGLFFFRGLGSRNTRGEMDPLPADTVVDILGGPECDGDANNILRWYVRVAEGSRRGYEGWMAEGITDERHMLPLTTQEE